MGTMKVNEAGKLFKPAGKAELANREDPQNSEISVYIDGYYDRELSPHLYQNYIDALKPGRVNNLRRVTAEEERRIYIQHADIGKVFFIGKGSHPYVYAVPKKLLESVNEAGMFKAASPENLAVRKEEMTKHLTAEQKKRHAEGIYYFDELSDSAKEVALDWARYMEVDYQGWWQHDYFFQPPDKELTKAGVPEGKMLFSFDDKNVYFDLDRGSFLEVGGLDVDNTDWFYNWLGIPRRLRDKIYYKFGTGGYRNSDTELEINKEDYSDFTPAEMKYVERAQEKFKDHVAWCLKGLRDDYEYRTSDEQVAETIRVNEYEFDEEGHRT